MRRCWRQTENGFVEIIATAPRPSVAPSIRRDVAPFRSPIDGSMINTRMDLENHNKRHGVSNDLDSLRDQTQKHMKSRGKPIGSKKERINALVESYDRVAASGFHREAQHFEGETPKEGGFT